MYSWTLRIAGWIVGIYALLKLAKATGAVTYTQVFQAWMDSLRDIVDLGFLLTPLKMAVILPALDFIRSFDIPIPPLQDHWQQVFVLTWLFMAAIVRNGDFGQSKPVALLAAFGCTLPFCVATGTMPVNSVTIALWPMLSIVVFFWVLGGFRDATLILTASLGVFLAYFLDTGVFGAQSNGPLLFLAICVGAAGIFFLYWALSQGGGTFWQRLQHRGAALGLDITAAMLGAFGLATVFADPPLF
jgi:hypothetical protein